MLSRFVSRSPLTYRFSVIGALAFAAAAGFASAQQGPYALAPVEAAARSPRVKSLGPVTTVCWVEKAGEGSAIRNIVLKDGRIAKQGLASSIRTISDESMRTTADLDVTINPLDFQPAVVWLESGETGDSIRFGTRHGETETIFASESMLELPVIEFDSEGNAFAAWSEISGGQSRIYAASRTEANEWTARVLSDAARPYDVLPQMFSEGKGVDLYWYAIDENEVFARRASLAPGEMGGTMVTSLGRIPANRLPVLYRATEEGLLGAIWLEQNETGETYHDFDPRDSDGPRVLGKPESTIQYPAVSDDLYAAKAYIQVTGEGARMLVAESPFSASGIHRQMPRTTGDPAISVSDNWIHLVWVNEGLDAEGSLFYWRTR